jgi:ABC-type enterochelin transport system permease subunit
VQKPTDSPTSSPLPAWIVLLVAAAATAYGAWVMSELVRATFVTPASVGRSFWTAALMVISGILASVLGFVLTPATTLWDRGRIFGVVAVVIRVVAVAGFWVSFLTALFRLVRRTLT